MTKVAVKSFVNQFLAIAKGDTVEAQAQKALRQAESALNTQIAVLTGDTVNLEEAVETAKEILNAARVNNGQTIEKREAYVQTLLNRKNDVTDAEIALEKHTAKLAFLKAELAQLQAEA